MGYYIFFYCLVSLIELNTCCFSTYRDPSKPNVITTTTTEATTINSPSYPNEPNNTTSSTMEPVTSTSTSTQSPKVTNVSLLITNTTCVDDGDDKMLCKPGDKVNITCSVQNASYYSHLILHQFFENGEIRKIFEKINYNIYRYTITVSTGDNQSILRCESSISIIYLYTSINKTLQVVEDSEIATYFTLPVIIGTTLGALIAIIFLISFIICFTSHCKRKSLSSKGIFTEDPDKELYSNIQLSSLSSTRVLDKSYNSNADKILYVKLELPMSNSTRVLDESAPYTEIVGVLAKR